MGKDLEETLNEADFWHFRYQQQVAWTQQTRRYLFRQAGVHVDDRMLDVGCGSGAVMQSLVAEGYTNLTGIDIDLSILTTKRQSFPVFCGDGMAIPFAANTFDHTFCHFTLMWVKYPRQMVCEMRRVTRSGGWIFLLAEPDYGGRLSYPQELEKLADLQTQALQRQGANTSMGRELMALLSLCELKHVFGGIIGFESSDSAFNALTGDLRVLQRDLRGLLPLGEIANVLERAQEAARSPGALWHVPICYACGQVS